MNSAFRTVARRSLLVISSLALTSVLIGAQVPPQLAAADVFGAMRAPGEPAFTVGHRGDRAHAPENTMPSLELAMDRLAYVETDVRLTKDGVPVISHDVTLERVAGVDRRVEDLTLAEVEALDVGSFYAPEFAGVRIPTLDEFLAALAERPTARALVELKAAWTPGQVRLVVGLIERHNLRGRIILESFSIESLLSIKAASPTTPRIMLTRELPADPRAFVERFGVVGFGTTAASVRRAKGAVRLLHAIGVSVLCYTLNSEEAWAKVSALGVDGIITDQPSELDAWLAATAPGT